jgi:hypothetical protein
LNNHINKVHKNLKPFQCKICLNSFGRKDYLRFHVLGVHVNTNLFECQMCSTTFSFKASLRKHSIKFHQKQNGFTNQPRIATSDKLRHI